MICGNFWDGLRQGVITAGLNEALHSVVSKAMEPPKSGGKQDEKTQNKKSWYQSDNFKNSLDMASKTGTVADAASVALTLDPVKSILARESSLLRFGVHGLATARFISNGTGVFANIASMGSDYISYQEGNITRTRLIYRGSSTVASLTAGAVHPAAGMIVGGASYTAEMFYDYVITPMTEVLAGFENFAISIGR